MKYKYWKLLLLSLAVWTSVFFSGCGDGKDASLRYDISGVVESLDPQYAYSEDARLVVRSAFEGLFSTDAEGNISFAAAEGYTLSENGLRCTITLRDGLFWRQPDSDEGPIPLTASDFEFALKRLFTPDYPSRFAADFTCIRNAGAVLSKQLPLDSLGVRAQDSRTLIIDLEYHTNALPQLLSSTAAMPCNEEFFDETRGRYGLSEGNLLCNGPFYVQYWEKDPQKGYVQLRKWSGFRDEESVFPSRLIFRAAQGSAASSGSSSSEAGTAPKTPAERLSAGDTDAAQLTYEEWDSLKNQQDYHCVRFEDTVWVLVFNQRREFFQNRSARLALAQAVNHLSYAPSLGNALNDTTAFLPPSLRIDGDGYRKLAGFDGPDLFSADEALQNYRTAVRQTGISPDLTLLAVNESNHPLLASFIQKNWLDTLGLTVRFEMLPRTTLNSRVQNGDYDIAIVPLRPDSQRPENALADFQSASTRNIAGFRSAEFDALLQRAVSTADPQERLSALVEAENYLCTEAVIVPLYFQTSYYVSAPSVTGIRFSPFAGETDFTSAVKK